MEVVHPSVVVLLTCAGISVMCTLLTLYIIRSISRWNGYIQVIFNLALAQLFYDGIMVLIPFRRYSSIIEAFYMSIRCMFGLIGTSYTNILASVVVYAVWKRSTYDIKKVIMYVRPPVLIVSIVIGIMVAYTQTIESENRGFWSVAYSSLRVLSILINLVLYIVVTITLYLRNRESSKLNDPLEELVKRFKYYPLAQVISRVLVVIHEANYGFEYYYSDGSVSLRKKISLYCYVITLPSLGFLYFLVFLKMSPGASDTLKHKLHEIFGPVCCKKEPPLATTENSDIFGNVQCTTNNSSANSEGEPSDFSDFRSDDTYRYSRDKSMDSGLHITARFSQFNKYDEEDLETEIEKLRTASTNDSKKIGRT